MSTTQAERARAYRARHPEKIKARYRKLKALKGDELRARWRDQNAKRKEYRALWQKKKRAEKKLSHAKAQDLANQNVLLPGEVIPFRRIIVRLYEPDLWLLETFMMMNHLNTHSEAVVKVLKHILHEKR